MNWIIGDSLNTSGQSGLNSARAGRASRAGARAGRIVRLVRMVKLYKYYSESNEDTNSNKKQLKKNENPQSASHLAPVVSSALETNNNNSNTIYPHTLQGIKEGDYESEKIQSQVSEVSLAKLDQGHDRESHQKKSNFKFDDEESKVGAAMSDITTKRVIILVLVMLICLPLMSYSSVDVSPSYGTHVFHEVMRSSLITSNGTNQVSEYSRHLYLLYFLFSIMF